MTKARCRSSRDRKVAATFPAVARARAGNVTARFRGRLERRKEARASRAWLRPGARGGEPAARGAPCDGGAGGL